MTKWVYTFGDGKAEGAGGDARPARRQGRQPRRDGESRPARAARLHRHDRGLHLFLRQRPALSGRARRREVDAALGACRAARPAAASATPTNPLLVSVRSGARASMPGMMDTVLNLGLNDETVAALARVARATSASPTTAIAASSRCIRTSCSTSSITSSRTSSRASRSSKGYVLDTDLDRRRLAEASSSATRPRSQSETRQALPAGPARAALGRHRRGVLVLDEQPRHHLSPAATTSRRPGARPSPCRPWCSATWATPRPPASPSRAIPRPASTRSTASSWSTRRARTSWPASARRRTSPRRPRIAAGSDKPSMETAMPEVFGELRRDDRSCSRRTTATCRTWSSRSSAASSGCCRRAPASAPPRRRCKIAVDMASEGLISREEAVARIDPAVARPAAASDHRSQGASAT